MADRHTTGRFEARRLPSWRGFAEAVHRRMVRSEFDGGLRLGTLSEGSRVLVETVNRRYEIRVRGGRTWISGHPEFCPLPVPVRVRGSNWGGSMLKLAYLGLGMHMEFQHPEHATVTTSRIVAIHLD